MAVSAEFSAYLEELFEPFGPVRLRRMFGGAGLFYGDVMFALVADDVLYFKVDDGTREDFTAAGKGPFVYQSKDGPRSLKNYYELPEGVLEDTDALREFSRRAIDVALAAARAKKPKPRKRRG